MKLFLTFKKDITSILLIFFLSATSSFAATINVPADQLTLDAAIAIANPGDVIILAPGTYIQTNKIFIDKPLTISSQWYTTGDPQYISQTIIEGKNKDKTLFETVHEQGFDFEISGLTITRFVYPIIINDSAVIQHNFMSNNSGDSISFEATSSGYAGFNTIEDSRDDGIDIDAREGTFTIEFNTIRNSGDDGMEIRLFNKSQPGITYDIHDNTFNGNDEDGLQLIDHTLDDSGRIFYIYNNVFDNNAMAGFGIMGDGNTTEDFSGSPTSERILFYNNTVTNNTVGVTGGDNFIALNNIIANNSNEGVKRLRLDSVIAHSIFYNNGTNITDAITDTGIILNVDPEYDPITYELSAGSPSIDKGVASYLQNGELVLDQNTSDYIGSAPDLGAKELDNGIIAENLTPIVSAGIDQVIIAPNNSISLEGEVNDDGLPVSQEAVTSFWTQDDGPGSVTFADASHTTTTASFSQQGIYHLRLTGDDSELTASDSMVIRYAKDGFGDTLSMLTPGSTFFEAEDYAYLYGAAAEISDDEASNNLVIKAQAGPETEAFTEHTLTVTEQDVTFYVWILGKGFDENSDSVFVSFADSAEVEVILPSNNSYDWVKMPGSFDRTAGSWPLIVRTDELGATWDRLLFTTDPDFVPVVNQPPTVNAGADQTISLPDTAVLNGTVTDDGQPDEALSSIWSQISGPGAITFNDPNNENTIATFSLPGTYVLELVANDSLRQRSDQVTITVQPISKVFYSQDIRISAETDDSEEITNSNIADTTSSDLELGHEGGPSRIQLIGLRFNNLSIPAGATITHAHIQFQTDEIDSIATSLNIQGEDTDNAVTFSSTNGDISNRPRTLASVTWNPTPWLTIGEAGAEQQTPDISTVIQQIVDRDGWLSSNSLAIIISGGGERTAEAFDGDPTAAALLHLEYSVVNQHPTVNAGLNQTITLPDTALLNGTVTDDNLPVDGVSSVWSLVSGPGTVTFDNPNLESATATFSQAGTYVLELTGDDSLVQETDQLTITVKPVNIQPVVNAGLDQTIALPNTALLSGSVTDDNQPIATLTSNWTQVSGPGIVTFNDPTLEGATATFSLPGTYVLELTGNDTLLQDTDQVTITVKPVNLQPVVNAGADQTITLPNTALLSGSVTDDNQPIATLTSSWTQVSGPGVVTFNDPTLERATATFSLPGTYVLELTGNDTLLQNTDQVTITVKPVNLQPVVNAGADQTITLPNTALLSGSVTDDNQPTATLTSSWKQVSGPGVVTFNNANLEGATATFSLAGTYVLELTGNDTLLQNTDQVTITVEPENLQPLANAGLDQTITLPNTALLNGSVSDDNLPNGTLAVTWSLISGPGTISYTDPNSASAIATFNQAGTYVLEITANDSLLQASDQVTITVNPIVNTQPTVNAGIDQTITYPNSSVLNGTVNDDNQPNGTLSSSWNQVSGPGTVTFDDPNSEDTTATYSEAGTYELELTATDGSLQSSDLVTITVNLASSEFNTIDVRISSRSDDAEQFTSSGITQINSSDLELVEEGGSSKNQQVGLRFNNLPIPQGATITHAYIQFQTDEIDSTAVSLIIEGESTDNALTFNSSAHNITNRPRTLSSITWSPVPWTIIGEQGPNQQTPDITTIIQEIVNQPGWLSDNSLAIIISGNGERTAVSYNGNALAAPLLHIEYSDGSSENLPPEVNNLAITGETKVGQQLTANYTYNDADGDLEGNSTFQWFRNGFPISGATLVNYTLVDADQGTLINFEVKPAATTGVSFGATRQSSDVGPVTTVDGVLLASARISVKTDDAEEVVATGAMVNSRDLELVDEGGSAKSQLVGLRFNNLSIPSGATITNAYIQFQTDEVDSKFTSLIIEGENTDNAETFSFDNGAISSRSRTLSAVVWNPLPWSTINEAGLDQQTTNISSVIQEIVDRAGWSLGNSLAIIISGSGERTAISYEGNPAAAAMLYVEYN